MPPGQIIYNEVVSINNAAGIGVVRALLDVNYRKKAHEIANNLICFGLNRVQDFSLKFAEASKLSPK